MQSRDDPIFDDGVPNHKVKSIFGDSYVPMRDLLIELS